MTNLKLFIIGCVALLLSSATYANVEDGDVTVLPIFKTVKFYVSFANDIETQKVSIKIRDAKGTLIYADHMSTQTNKVYDMAEYGKGKFMIEIIGEDFKLVKEVEVGKVGDFNARIIQTKERVDLIYLSKAQELDIYLKDKEGNILYEGTGKFGKYRQPFNIQNLPSGTYTLKVTNGKQVFEEDFQVK